MLPALNMTTSRMLQLYVVRLFISHCTKLVAIDGMNILCVLGTTDVTYGYIVESNDTSGCPPSSDECIREAVTLFQIRYHFAIREYIFRMELLENSSQMDYYSD